MHRSLDVPSPGGDCSKKVEAACKRVDKSVDDIVASKGKAQVGRGHCASRSKREAPKVQWRQLGRVFSLRSRISVAVTSNKKQKDETRARVPRFNFRPYQIRASQLERDATSACQFCSARLEVRDYTAGWSALARADSL